MADAENTDMDFSDCWKVDGEVVVSLNLGATHITTACLRLAGDDRVPIPLIKIEGSGGYKEYLKSILQYEPDPRYVVIGGEPPVPFQTDFANDALSDPTSRGLVTVNGVDVQPLSYYNNDSTHSMIRQTFDNVISALRTKYGIDSKLGLIVCPRNLSATTKELVYPDRDSVSHCDFPRADPTQSMNRVSGVVMMDGSSGTRRGYGIRSYEEERKFEDWVVLTIAVFPNMVQIIRDEGQVMGLLTDTYKSVPGVVIDENCDWTGLADVLRAFKEITEDLTIENDTDRIVRVVITGDIEPSAAVHLSTAIENVAPYLRGKIQGFEDPAFISAMGAACVSYEWHPAKRRGDHYGCFL